MQPVNSNNQSTILISQGTFRALIIGNNEYRDPKGKWPSLKTASFGAKSVANLLKKHYGFTDIELLINASRSDILHPLGDLSKRVNTYDSVLLYYAGHGFLDTDTSKGYWIPVDAKGEDDSTFLRNSTIRDEMSIIASRVKHTLLISDSCFSGSLLRTTSRGIPPTTGVERYYKKISTKKSVQIMSAGGLEFVDDNYRNSGHSPFTYFLLNELKHNDRPLITLSELSTNVQKAVANNVDQTPETGVLQGAGDELGEFIFLKMEIAIEVKGTDKDKIKVNIQVTPTVGAIPIELENVIGNSVSKKNTEPHKPKKIFIPLPTL
ncbi:MAG: caspase family protein [Gammaproteobacteria bacterium]|nr:caspase family protein [Gammaproteobacteria bacterium]